MYQKFQSTPISNDGLLSLNIIEEQFSLTVQRGNENKLAVLEEEEKKKTMAVLLILFKYFFDIKLLH